MIRCNLLIFGLAAILIHSPLAIGQKSQVPRVNRRIPEGTSVQKDIVYAAVGERKLHLDFYHPSSDPGDELLPLVVWVHGGGWRSGSKNGAGPSLALLSRGFAVASIEYRLSGEAIFPAAVADCKAAVSFLRHHAEKFRIDADRIGAWGSSAGGHLVSMLGTTGDDTAFQLHPITKDSSSAVQAVCNWFGPTDFLRMNDTRGAIDHDSAESPESRFIGGRIQENPEKVQRANPVSYITKVDPPFLHLHGSNDRLVPLSQSQLFHDALRSAGVSSNLHVVKGGGHGFGGAEEPMKDLVERSIGFFETHLSKAK
ncbi:MAG: alpha/beta hydrolase fold domain-containing protein [Rubripirellula sp.]